MPGIQEILVLLLIVSGILFLPRLFSRGADVKPVRTSSLNLSGPMRLAIMATIIWIGLTAFLSRPWEKGLIAFLLWGIGPILLCWGMFWVFRGFRSGS